MKAALIGNRELTQAHKAKIREVSLLLAALEYEAISGGAEGADSEFVSHFKQSTVYKAKDATPESIELASQFHPAWDNCSDYVKQLMGRNAMIQLGPDLKTPVNICVGVCRNEHQGGTALGFAIARANKIPVWNIHSDQQTKLLLKYLRERLRSAWT